MDIQEGDEYMTDHMAYTWWDSHDILKYAEREGFICDVRTAARIWGEIQGAMEDGAGIDVVIDQLWDKCLHASSAPAGCLGIWDERPVQHEGPVESTDSVSQRRLKQ